jgi:hypothetical protein
VTFSLKVEGLAEIEDVYDGFLESVIESDAPETTAKRFADSLEARTPIGFTGKLKATVLVEQIDDYTFAAGFSSGVERPGNTVLDAKKKTGRSVLWVGRDELEDIFEDAIGEFRGESVLMAGIKEDAK